MFGLHILKTLLQNNKNKFLIMHQGYFGVLIKLTLFCFADEEGIVLVKIKDCLPSAWPSTDLLL